MRATVSLRVNKTAYLHTYRVCDHTGEKRWLFIETRQDEFNQGEPEINVERCESQLVFDPGLKTKNAALLTYHNISTCKKNPLS